MFSKKTLSGVLESPNYPGDYPTNITCIWKIKPSKNRRILVIIPDIDIPKEDKCGDQLVMRKSSKSYTIHSTTVNGEIKGPGSETIKCHRVLQIIIFTNIRYFDCSPIKTISRTV